MVCETKEFEVPTVPVEGVGAVADPVPPVKAVYHFKEVPVAVKAVAVAFWQYVTGEVTVGTPGIALIVTAMVALELSHPLTVCDT
jgi:hypothetical protein